MRLSLPSTPRMPASAIRIGRRLRSRVGWTLRTERHSGVHATSDEAAVPPPHTARDAAARGTTTRADARVRQGRTMLAVLTDERPAGGTAPTAFTSPTTPA